MATTFRPLPLWRVYAVHPRVGQVRLLVRAETAALACAIIDQPAKVVRCVREVRS